jgi:hypothetical protein
MRTEPRISPAAGADCGDAGDLLKADTINITILPVAAEEGKKVIRN